VADTYRPYFKGSIKSIDTSTIEVCKIEPSQKNFAEAKRHFLYFGSLGLVHKGLDLVLKAFAKRPDCFLHVCIPLSNEPLFERTFHKELYETANIKTYGFIDIRSELFKRLLNQCAFLIFPSASEGGCAGQANLMRNGGLIPLMTLNAGLDIEDFGIIIQSFSVESVLRSIIEAETLTEADCQKRAEQSLRYALERHTLEQFHHTFKKHLLAVLDETKPLWTKSP
jgi:glycosyltransferase involved in cell wall biosynthesis